MALTGSLLHKPWLRRSLWALLILHRMERVRQTARSRENGRRRAGPWRHFDPPDLEP